MRGRRGTRWIGGAAAAALLACVLTVPASAQAAGWLSKGAARAMTVSGVRQAYLDLDFATSYWVEPASSCSRFGYSVVECDWKLYGDGIICNDATRVRRMNSGSLRIRFPYRSDCRSTGASTTPTRPPSYTPPSYTPPTTGNFGNGTGTVGYCADGTLSDSIGRPGACSWHGGVAP